MCCFIVVIKLLILKILFAGLTTSLRYDYGYHPSAEEFDHRLRETQHTWTHTFLKNKKDRFSMKPAEHHYDAVENRATTAGRYFVPKFQYKNNKIKKFNQFLQNSQDLRKHSQPLQNIGSSLDFNYFSDELPAPFKIKQTFITKAPTTTTTAAAIKSTTDLKPIASVLPQNNLNPFTKPNNHLLNNLHKNKTLENFPIYFTNPATGITYAITEIGKSTENVTTSNGAIPIFITKGQYERDILQLKNEYKQKCQNFPINHTTTPRPPEIIRLQKPIISTTFATASATPSPIKKPSPVVIKTELIVKDKRPATVARPLRKKKKPKIKQKLKIKKKNPGAYKNLRTTIKPIIITNQPEGPVILLGSRLYTGNSYENTEKLSTQLEKPNFDNIFSMATVPPKLNLQSPNSRKSNIIINNHKVKKRSLGKKLEEVKDKDLKIETLPNLEITLKTFAAKEINFFKNSSIVENNYVRNYSRKIFPDFWLKEMAKPDLIKRPIIDKTFSKNSNKTIKENFLKIQNISTKLTNNNFSKLQKKTKKSFKKLKKNIKKFPLINSRDLQKSKNITTAQTKKRLFKTQQFSGKFTDFINKFSSIQPKNKSDFKNQNKTNLTILSTGNLTKNLNNLPLRNKLKTTNFSKNSKNRNLKSSQITDNFKSDSKNYNFMKLKHHLNKRSTVDLAKNFSTLPKLRKRSNKMQNSNLNQKIQENITTLDELKINSQNLEQQNNIKVKIWNSANSTETTKNLNQPSLIIDANKMRIIKYLKKRKRLSKVKLNKKSNLINSNFTLNRGNTSHHLVTTPRATKSGIKSLALNKKKLGGSPKRQQDTEYYVYDLDENYDEDEENYEEDDEYNSNDDDDDNEEQKQEEESKEENFKNQHEILAYNDEPYQTPTNEVSLSVEDFSAKPLAETNSSLKKESENTASKNQQQEHLIKPNLDYDNKAQNGFKTKSTHIKKRIRRRPPQLKIDEDYDEYVDDDDNSISSNLGGFFRMIFYPIQMVMSSVMDSFDGKDAEEEDDEPNFNPYTQYTSYHSTLKQPSNEEYDDDYDDTSDSSDSSLSSWFSSWFAFKRRNKKIGSTTAVPLKLKPTKSSWLPSWLGFGSNDRISTDAASHEDGEYDKWFASWFGETKPKARKRTTTTTSTTTQIPHVPILTIVDPMRNPQNWIGILAHHIINHTSTSTVNPLMDIWNKVTTTTTENPEMPRKISYDKYQIWRLKPQDDSQVQALEEYKKSEDGIKLQWLKGPSLRGLTDVLVPPKMLVDFQASLTFELIDHEVLIFDVGRAIAYEKTKEDYFFTTTQKPKKHGSKISTSIKGMTWHKYYEYDDIMKYLQTMRMRFPHLVELLHIGRSYEGRPLIVMKIESKEAAAVNSAHYPAHQRTKLRHRKHIGLANAVFLEAGIHGMEWIAPATATWIINELLRIVKKNVTDDQSFIRNTTWYIMPVLNPDGYVYSHEFDRFWKKSRSRHISRPSGILNSAMTWLQKKRVKEKICFGVDLDRNWHYQWGRRGSSKSACNDFYAGPTPFSEPETKALSEFLMDYRTQIKLFVSMQSYGQIISYPYKANTTYDSERLEDLLDVAMVGTDGLRKKGSKSRFKIDSSYNLVENRSGCSDAFAAYEVGIPFSYTLQLADNGVHGYLLPSAAIESTAKDSFEIIKGMLDYI